MPQLACFLYSEEDFSPPPVLRSVRPNICMFVDRDETGRLRPHPRVFREVTRPEDADVFLFPWDIGQYVDGGALETVARLIAALPFFAGRERRHIVCDNGDAAVSFPLPVCLFKISVTTALRDEAVVFPYPLQRHMFTEKPVFDWNAIRYDTSFVGNLTNPVRRAIVTSVRRREKDLRLLADFDDAPLPDGRHCFNTREKGDPAKTAERQRMYRKSLRESLSVLCPPGVGPHSIRMCETMYMGRMPVLFGDSAVYPFERKIDYSAFSLHIGKDAILETGDILADWFGTHQKEEIHERCVLACRTWNACFAPGKVLPLLLEEARAKFWE